MFEFVALTVAANDHNLSLFLSYLVSAISLSLFVCWYINSPSPSLRTGCSVRCLSYCRPPSVIPAAHSSQPDSTTPRSPYPMAACKGERSATGRRAACSSAPSGNTCAHPLQAATSSSCVDVVDTSPQPWYPSLQVRVVVARTKPPHPLPSPPRRHARTHARSSPYPTLLLCGPPTPGKRALAISLRENAFGAGPRLSSGSRSLGAEAGASAARWEAAGERTRVGWVVWDPPGAVWLIRVVTRTSHTTSAGRRRPADSDGPDPSRPSRNSDGPPRRLPASRPRRPSRWCRPRHAFRAGVWRASLTLAVLNAPAATPTAPFRLVASRGLRIWPTATVLDRCLTGHHPGARCWASLDADTSSYPQHPSHPQRPSRRWPARAWCPHAERRGRAAWCPVRGSRRKYQINIYTRFIKQINIYIRFIKVV